MTLGFYFTIRIGSKINCPIIFGKQLAFQPFQSFKLSLSASDGMTIYFFTVSWHKSKASELLSVKLHNKLWLNFRPAPPRVSTARLLWQPIFPSFAIRNTTICVQKMQGYVSGIGKTARNSLTLSVQMIPKSRQMDGIAAFPYGNF